MTGPVSLLTSTFSVLDNNDQKSVALFQTAPLTWALGSLAPPARLQQLNSTSAPTAVKLGLNTKTNLHCTPIDQFTALAMSRLDMRPAGTAAMLNIAWIGSFSEASVKLVCHVGSGDKRDALVNVSRSWVSKPTEESERSAVSKTISFDATFGHWAGHGMSSLAAKNCPFVSKHLPGLDRFVSSGLKVMLPQPAILWLQKSLSSVLVLIDIRFDCEKKRR